MKIGYKLAAEAFGPQELVRQAVRAEQAGFDFVEISDHFHPWVEAQGHSPFAWNVLSVIAAKTTTLNFATGVTCPSVRYHPAIIAQAAATLALLSDGRFTLGVGAGERLNEHIVGRGFPGIHERHAMFDEALDIIRLLWQGGYQNYDGRYLKLEDARIFDLPEVPPTLAVAVSGPASVALAAEHGDGLFAVEPKSDLVSGYRDAGGTGPLYCEAPLAWAPSEEAAIEAALETNAWSLSGWKVMSELPNPVNFEAASTTVRADDIREQFACGPDVERHLEVIGQFTDAGFDHIALMNSGPDVDGFFDFFQRELRPRLATE
ncbi:MULTISPECIES: TIGR03557 family F420-dependent LLM class oxidoreductase [unclassified Leifsonia]|uniref:TIGR03557 family F420-dependent LLM class oxidoreductase n=1 Tax=unclassified Leifsonia TaxID=2663824 RepID=UPI0006FB6074|nr:MULTISPECIES: TIGR03557 family F420-dependent LLM class oxidoreductase [unclassified Leifsonia]KQX07612.1 LLM class F420-dependent oxidoreductase [Leifsonia sp. Root1293]KRA11894.1 LLM class F420-dependent oxidoreductase [Leifsonia sp. Root60]